MAGRPAVGVCGVGRLYSGQIGLGLFVAGLGVLIWRMPHQRDPDDDGPGAVV